MKKIIFYLISLIIFISCGKYQDGEYYAIKKEAYKGWKTFLKIEVKNNEIVSVEFNKVNKDNKLVTEDKEYNKKMKEKTGIDSVEYTKILEEKFLKSNGNINDIDIVAGATHSVVEFKNMSKFLLKKIKKGKTGKYEVN